MTAIWQSANPGPHPTAARPVLSEGRQQATLCLALLNLMPNKPVTERHFAHAFAAATRPIEWILTVPDGYRPTTTPESHLRRFYTPWSRLDLARLDGLVVTGAPVELLPFEEVRYWPALTRIFDQARTRRLPSLFICWSAQAALYHRHGVPKHALPEKCFGIFEQRVLAPEHALLASLAPSFHTPVSRHTEVRAEDIPARRGLEILASSPDSGLCLVAEPAADSLYMFNHLEYETDTLALEYARDLAAGAAVSQPANYYSRRLPGAQPINLWAGAAQRFFANWAKALSPIYRPAYST